MFEKHKRTRYIAAIGFVIVGGMVVKNSCHAVPACVCGPGLGMICLPTDKRAPQAKAEAFCVQEGKAREKNCPLNMNATGCWTMPLTS